MSSAAWKPEWLESQDSSSLTERIKTIVLAVYHRVRRGGLGLLFKVTGILFVLAVCYQLVPGDVSKRYHNFSNFTPPEETKPGGLRIVAFGSQDLMGSAPDAASDRLTWPQKLCQELNCSSLLSFIPTSEYSPGLTSNEIYERELQVLRKIAQDTDVTDNPASDYLFVNEQHPVPTQTPDLEAQIAQFLSLPPSEAPPVDTLWIFSFGTWDIWKLAAMPLQSGEKIVDLMGLHIFDKIESLYRKSLDPRSVAFSNFWSNSTEEEFKMLADPEAASTVDHRKLESFRVLIPQLLDVSLTPGWHNRPPPSVPHTPAEQMRNSALLTDRWNYRIREFMEKWTEKRQASPEGMENESSVKDATVAPKVGSSSESGPRILRVASPEAEKPFDANVVYAPYPQRLGLHAKPADVILETMKEEDMQKDTMGDVLAGEDVLRFSDVWTACVPSNPHASDEDTAGQASTECKMPEEHLFYTSFTVGQRAIDELAKLTADAVLEGLIIPPPVSGKA